MKKNLESNIDVIEYLSQLCLHIAHCPTKDVCSIGQTFVYIYGRKSVQFFPTFQMNKS